VNRIGRVITIGLSPAWDVCCRGRGLDWGCHAQIDERVVRPAGKAMNVSSALAWMGCENVAAGLWGRDDYEAMRSALRARSALVHAAMTAAQGRTRENITVVDTTGRREMHLRQVSRLATRASLACLQETLTKTVRKNDICVFAGAMPSDELLDAGVALVQTCHKQGARIVADTYGPVLERLVDAGLPWLIAPNVEELAQLLGAEVRDTPVALAAMTRVLLEKVPTILVSRGRKGAVLVTRTGVWTGRTTTRGRVLDTVGCGDYLLAGFLAGYGPRENARAALTTALKVATARAYGWIDSRTWRQAGRRIQVEIQRL